MNRPPINRLVQLFRRRAPLPASIAAAVDEWRGAAPVAEATPLAHTRFVVLDVETSGLNPRRDHLLSIGAVAVEGMKVAPGAAFSAVLRSDAPLRRDNVALHGLTPAKQAAGEPPDSALTRFLAFVGKAPCVAYHAAFDRTVLGRALRTHLGVRLPNPWLDLAQLAPALVPEARRLDAALDDWLAYFRLHVHVRHDAVHDAGASAELFLILLARAERRGLTTLAQLLAAALAHMDGRRV